MKRDFHSWDMTFPAEGILPNKVTFYFGIKPLIIWQGFI